MLASDFMAHISQHGIALNDEQREAVCHTAGPLVVFAGPGSGKTTVLTCRAAYLLQVEKVPAAKMLIVTFTRAAAAEMQARLAAMPGIGQQSIRAAEIGTFHSVFMRMLMQQNGGQLPQLMEEYQQRTIIKALLREQGEDGDDEQVADVLSKIGLCKNNLILPERIKATKPENQKFRDLFAGYERVKRQEDRWDYDDILVAAYAMLKHNPAVREYYQRRFEYLLVDEFQDTNLAQYEVIKMLAGHGNLCIVGDDDQSIYRFRGSRVEFLLDFETTFPGAKKVILAVNYRSTDDVIDTASRVILHNRVRQSKLIRGTGRAGEKPVVLRPEGEKDEAEQILTEVAVVLEHDPELEPQEVAILYRTNIQVRAMIDGLVQKGLPFTLHDADGDFYGRWQVRDVLTYFKLAYNPDDLDSIVQIINRPKRYLYPDRFVDEVHMLRRTKNITYLEALAAVESLEPYQRTKVEQLIKDLIALRLATPAQALHKIRKEIGYDRYLEEFAAKTGNDAALVSEPLEELEQAVLGHRTLHDFLAHVEEVKETVRRSRGKGEGIQLMTMHKSKGLEFKHVYCIGLVEDMLPHPKALQAEGDKQSAAVEEERRLFYVGMTRAKRYLTLSAPLRYHGRRAEPSPFLYETGLLPRPKRTAITPPASVRKQPVVMKVPASERMKAAMEKHGGTAFAVGDSLHHKDLGPGLIQELKVLSGDSGRRVLIQFPGQEKVHDLHLELCLYLGLLSAPVNV
ncbi:DNA helicase-2/ATP-dependent DNA helicase PcrA [Tumebacillus sp. BK434]|uniref:ATP-dependent helicase n=1 Tax=Tumebacillus sp. BK434 TaxID=2512169 RepID=UPI001053FE6D|nr:ATP-dependent helicase [Tumebacillus sp. BK434]TCP59440.1 DNA helicase-2/ATP-dependent DNA helicase PcrA [Tumebacillus sp. BK434]